MTVNGFLQIGIYLVVLLGAREAARRLHGARLRRGSRRSSDGSSGRSSASSTASAASEPDEGMTWKTYAIAMLLFNAIGVLVVYALQRLQGVLPLNPQGFGAVTPDSSFNTAVSFVTNTNWQGYGGETTMSYLTQMLGLTVQNFVSAATAMAILVALIRGFRSAKTKRHRQLLGRPHAQRRSTSCCRSRSCWRSSWSRRAWCRTSAPTRR